MSAWIHMIADADASEDLKRACDTVRSPAGTVDNVMRVHSLRPHSMEGHYALYMSALHHPGNTLPGWFLETVACYTSLLNDCPYSLTNHFANASHLMADGARAAEVLAALKADKPEQAFEGKELALLRYAGKLTRTPGAMVEADVLAAREAGASDGEVLEVNHVCGYFNYVNRLLNGLGVTLKGDVIGYYNEPQDAARTAEPAAGS